MSASLAGTVHLKGVPSFRRGTADRCEGRRLDSLTGLRFVAALAVFGTHCQRFLPRFHSSVFNDSLKQGASGVSFFFILSGFVLTWSYRPNDGAGAFYRRRFARVYPAYVAALVLGIVVVVLRTGRPPGVGLIAANLLLIQSWFTTASVYWSVNGVAWSLSCEAAFYLTFPFWIHRFERWTAGRRHLALGLLVLLAIGVPVLLADNSEGTGWRFWMMYIFPGVRLFEFLIGILIGLEMRSGARSPLNLLQTLVLALIAYAIDGYVPVHLMWVAVTVIPFGLLIWAAASADLAGSWSPFRARAMVRLGQWSFAFYLIHQSVITGILALHPADGWSVTVMTTVGALGASIVAAAVLYHLVEHPLERRLRGYR